MTDVAHPNDPVTGQFGTISLPPNGLAGVPIASLPGKAMVAALAASAHAEPQIGDAPRLDRLTPRPVTLNFTFQNSNGQGNNPATTYTYMVAPQVSPGKIWLCLRVGVTGPDPFTALPGVSVLLFRSSTIPQDSNTEPPTFGDLIAVLGTVPNTSYPAWKAAFARGNERFALALKGLANSQALQASMDVIEYDLYSYLCSLASGG